MLTRKLYDYLLSANYSSYGSENSMNANNRNVTRDGKELNVRAKTLLNRREPTLSHNVTLLIELGIVVTVIIIVGLVFYLSHRNFKRRTNIHRRRWLESDATIDNYSDGQFYDRCTTLHECQAQPIDLDQDDCPPPYESVVQQSMVTMRKKRRQHTKNSNASDINLPKRNDEPQHSSINIRMSEPLIPKESFSCISTIYNEDSLLIENRHLASTSYENPYDGVEGSKMCSREDIEVNVARTHKTVGAEIGKEIEMDTNQEKFEIVAMKSVGCGNDIALLDASGLPTYATAIKIQECGNI